MMSLSSSSEEFNECSVALYVSSRLIQYVGARFLPVTSQYPAPCLPVAVQRAMLQGNSSKHDTRDRESEEEPGAAEHGKLCLFSHIVSNVTYFYSP